LESIVTTPSSGRDVINAPQNRKGQHVTHVTMVTRVMVLEVVLNANLMNVVLQTQHPPFQVVLNVHLMDMDVDCVQKGITLMIHLVHV
jgi:hypothetical protein